ncbi:MAG: hypothetical protein J3K34DRAFT_159793 [Monoraphidium minutum]|nr:MAG: hypothetical protein J3K34DRAFT_159793 [Monoraphidium minutum]
MRARRASPRQSGKMGRRRIKRGWGAGKGRGARGQPRSGGRGQDIQSKRLVRGGQAAGCRAAAPARGGAAAEGADWPRAPGSPRVPRALGCARPRPAAAPHVKIYRAGAARRPRPRHLGQRAAGGGARQRSVWAGGRAQSPAARAAVGPPVAGGGQGLREAWRSNPGGGHA